MTTQPAHMEGTAMEMYWHFVPVDSNGTPRLGYDDNREVVAGQTLTITGKPVLCKRGLHASRKVSDALSYVQSDRAVLCRVTLGGTVVHGDDKSCATERTVVAILDAGTTDKLLRDFARWCALQVIHLWDAPDIVRQYLETGDESLRAAAGAAAWAAAQAAAREAARAAAWAAAGAAAGAAARAAARAAAWAAAGAAARAVKIREYAAELERRALDALMAAQQEGGE